MRPSAERKWVWSAWEWKIISISQVVHFTSFWYRGWGELGKGLFARVDMTPHFRNSRENGYKHWMQWFLGSFDDWSMVFKATINQSQATLVHPNGPRNRCAESLYPFPLIVSGVGNRTWANQSRYSGPIISKKKKSGAKKKPRIRARCYQYLRIYLSHLNTLKPWGDFFPLPNEWHILQSKPGEETLIAWSSGTRGGQLLERWVFLVVHIPNVIKLLKSSQPK